MYLIAEQYQDYMRSEAWKEKARQRLEIDKHRCQFCGARGTGRNPLVVHHFHYRSLGNEDVWNDLVTVCECCHKGLHSVMNRCTSPDGSRGWKTSLPNLTAYSVDCYD